MGSLRQTRALLNMEGQNQDKNLEDFEPHSQIVAPGGVQGHHLDQKKDVPWPEVWKERVYYLFRLGKLAFRGVEAEPFSLSKRPWVWLLTKGGIEKGGSI